jgi:hypothetical protein
MIDRVGDDLNTANGGSPRPAECRSELTDVPSENKLCT